MDLSELRPGLVGAADLRVGVEHTAPSIGSGAIPVLGTPVMINLMEGAALAAVEHLLPAGHQKSRDSSRRASHRGNADRHARARDR